MKNIEEIASEYVSSFGEVMPGFKYGFTGFREFTFKYYYDFVFLTLNGEVPDEPPVVGGSCGFIIDKKTHEIQTLTFGDFALLENKERELDDIYDKLTNLKENSKSLTWLKFKYQLNSPELLRIKKQLQKIPLQKEIILEQLNEILTK